MGKTYNMGALLKDMRVTKPNPGSKGKYADGPVVAKKSNNYVAYDGSIMTKKQKQSYDDYHSSKGKKC